MACDSPYYVNNPRPWTGEDQIPVPCGRCPLCLKRRVNSWVFRLLQEEKRSTSSYFITLTYDTKTIPITQNGFMNLQRSDLTKFWKRLRKLQKSKIKYYAVGEYGTKSRRPHYHAIVFNIEDISTVSTAWNLGYVHVGVVSGDSIGYTASYVNKGKTIPEHSRDDRIKEYSVMSNHLGDNYLSADIIKYHKADVERNYVTLEGGARVALPRYYRDRIYDSNEKAHQRAIIEKETLEKEKELLAAFNRKYKGQDITFEYYKDQPRYQRAKSLKSFNQHSNRTKL